MTPRPSRAIPALVGLLALLTMAGCASRGLDVRYPEAGVNPSMLAGTAPRRVDVRPVTDRRLDPGRIGTAGKKGDLVTSRPVVDIVRDALVLELSTNGHTLGPAPMDVVVAADVEEFWLDVVTGYAKTQYVGKVALALVVSDGPTGNTLVSRRYVGIKRTQVDKMSDDVARRVMDDALARTMHDLATDPALVAALAASTGPPPPR